VNFGRRWRVPKLVLAIPGSAEFLARAPGVWQKRAAIIKARSPLSPLLPCSACSRLSSPLLSLSSPLLSAPLSSPLSPLLVSSRFVSSRLASPHLASPLASCCCCRARARSLTRPFARSRFAGWRYPPLQLPHARNRKGETAAARASARVERKKIGRADDGGWSSYRSR
jgi:hypothetical protein